MTQYNSTFRLTQKAKKTAPAPKKGELVVERKFNSNMLYFKVQGGGQVPEMLTGGYTSMVEWDKAKSRYLLTVKRPEKRVVKDAPVEPTSPVLKDKIKAKAA